MYKKNNIKIAIAIEESLLIFTLLFNKSSIKPIAYALTEISIKLFNLGPYNEPIAIKKAKHQ